MRGTGVMVSAACILALTLVACGPHPKRSAKEVEAAMEKASTAYYESRSPKDAEIALTEFQDFLKESQRENIKGVDYNNLLAMNAARLARFYQLRGDAPRAKISMDESFEYQGRRNQHNPQKTPPTRKEWEDYVQRLFDEIDKGKEIKWNSKHSAAAMAPEKGESHRRHGRG
jgi:hypothetical protein